MIMYLICYYYIQGYGHLADQMIESGAEDNVTNLLLLYPRLWTSG